jgi:NAD(P)-dependent dehydrogenase (short-subunit alcohol dehydrogenase family)
MITAQTFRLGGRLALVRGSSAGIGLALARGLAQAGASVVLNGRDAAKLAQTAAMLKDEGLDVHARGFDVTEREAVDAGASWLINRTPSRRWGDVEDLAGAAVFLASDAPRFVNGHILYVDGGVTATL